VEVGLVKKLQVFVDEADNRKTKVKVSVWIHDDIAIPADSKITINQLGILGEKYLEIIPGNSVDMIKDDSVTVGQDPVPIERIAEQVNTLMVKLGTTVDSVNTGILTDKNKQSLEDALAGLGAMGTDLKEGRGTLGKLLTDESIYDNLDDLTSDLKGNPWKLLYRPKPK
jgi:phospholipid/cholesterol/gamma-HCH transport system substrate-binding protein